MEDAFLYLSKKVGISEFFVGFVILSAVSSLPEFSIALSSNNTIPQLSVGNLLGATLILLTLVIGLTAFKFKNIEFKGRFGEIEIFSGLIVIFLSVVCVLDRELSILEGIALITTYLLYTAHLYQKFNTHNFTKNIVNEIKVDMKNLFRMILGAALGCFLILLASSLLVDVIIELGKKVEVNETLVGLFVLALGTNIPELAIISRARNARHRKLATGNIIGSAAINSFILGILAILSQGVKLSNEDFFASAPILILITFTVVLFGFFCWTGRKLTRVEGIMLFAIYVSLILAEAIWFLVN